MQDKQNDQTFLVYLCHDSALHSRIFFGHWTTSVDWMPLMTTYLKRKLYV